MNPKAQNRRTPRGTATPAAIAVVWSDDGCGSFVTVAVTSVALVTVDGADVLVVLEDAADAEFELSVRKVSLIPARPMKPPRHVPPPISNRFMLQQPIRLSLLPSWAPQQNFVVAVPLFIGQE